MKDLFRQELRDMYDSEKRIINALSKLIEVTACPEVKSALQAHLRETRDQKVKLETVFDAIGENPETTVSLAMNGITGPSDDPVSKTKSLTLNAVAICAAQTICAAQKVEDFEIATYGGLHTWAQLLDNPEAARMLKEFLEERERAADRTLKELSAAVNEDAVEEVGAEVSASNALR